MDFLDAALPVLDAARRSDLPASAAGLHALVGDLADALAQRPVGEAPHDGPPHG